jgi:hypothetical protein
MTISNTLSNVTIDFAKVENVDEIIIAAGAKLDNVTIKNMSADTDAIGAAYKDAFVKINAGATVNNLVFDGCDFTSTSGKRDVAIYNTEPTASVSFNECSFDGIGYVFWTDAATLADLTFDTCTFKNNQSWVVMHNKTPYNGNLTVNNCVFDNCKKGLIKLTSSASGEMTAGHTFTFTNNTVSNCNGNNGTEASLFLADAENYVISGNTKDGATWNPDATNGLK